MSSQPSIGLSVLRTLHRIHRQLTDLREQRERGPKQIRAAETNIQRREDDLNRIKSEARTLRMASDQKQLQLKTGEEKVKDLKRKLNAASSNREYQALLDQIAADEMTNSVLADEILEALEKVDAFGKTIADSESALSAAKRKADEIRAEAARQEPILSAEIARLEAELKETESALPPDIAELYQRGVRQKGEDALAKVENQYCAGCNQQVPLNLCNQIMLGKPMFCKTCGRLLYLPE